MTKYYIMALLLISLSAFSQTDKERFQKTFDEEMEPDNSHLARQNHSSKYALTKPQVVPDWFFNPPVGSANDIYAIGISDPGLDSLTSMNMAVYRAQVVANILRKSTTQLICDFFFDEALQSNQIVYEHYSRIYTLMPASNPNIQIVNSVINEFGEAIVLIKYTPPAKVDPAILQTVQCDIYKNETDQSIYGNYESVYELLVRKLNNDTAKPMLYQLTEYGPRFDVGSSLDSLHSTIPIYSLNYVNIPGTDTLPYRVFSHGLWKEFYKSMVSNIVSTARQKPENISQLASKHNTESYQKLTRGMSENRMRFVISNVQGSGNALTVGLLELPIDK